MAFKIKTISKTHVPGEREVMESMTRLRHDMAARAKALWIVIGAVIVVVVGAGGIYFMNVQAERLSQEQLQQATQLYMNRPLNDTDAGLSHVRQAVELFRSVVVDYPETPSAPLAMHLLGNSLSVLGDHEGAIATYQQFLDAYPLQGSLNSLVHQRLAYAYLEQGDLQNAEHTFEKILTIDKAPNKDLALLELASLGEQHNQSDAAMARYQELIKEYPHSVYFSEASTKVGILGGGTPAVSSPDPAALESD